MSDVVVVAGGMFGSEGKGHVAAEYIRRAVDRGRKVVNIRVAGPNAGHTVVDSQGVSFPLRSIPVGGALGVECAIAPGSEVDLQVLEHEFDMLGRSGHRVDLVVAGEATLLRGQHHEAEAQAGLSGRIGSTGEGIGAARADRIWRTADRLVDDDQAVERVLSLRYEVERDWPEYIDEVLNSDALVVVEGTQGYGLGLHAGMYPQCTSSDTRAIDFMAMAGISPWHAGVDRVTVVLACRVFPIRVAGNSGPLLGETSWESLGLPSEHTTVTRKVRRVGKWDGDLVHRAVAANGGSPTVVVALTMVDQKLPAMQGCGGSVEDLPAADRSDLRALVEQVELDAGTRVEMVTTSPDTAVWM